MENRRLCEPDSLAHEILLFVVLSLRIIRKPVKIPILHFDTTPGTLNGPISEHTIEPLSAQFVALFPFRLADNFPVADSAIRLVVEPVDVHDFTNFSFLRDIPGSPEE